MPIEAKNRVRPNDRITLINGSLFKEAMPKFDWWTIINIFATWPKDQVAALYD